MTAVFDHSTAQVQADQGRVDCFAELDNLADELESAGWLALASGPKRHEVRVRQEGPARTHIAHFFTSEQWDDCHQRVFRDWLRAHPEDRVRYEQVKRQVAEQADDVREYAERKRGVVQEITNRARGARGLSRVDLDAE